MSRPLTMVAHSGAEVGHRYLKRQQVEALTGLSRATIYRRMDRGDFPRPLDLGPGCVRWTEADIAEWKAGHSPKASRT